MALQQVVTIQLNMLGDGVSTVFTYSFNKLFDITLNGDSVINPSTLPSSVAVTSVSGTLPSAVGSLDSNGNLIITFSSAPGNGVSGVVTVQLFFASGTSPAQSTSSSNIITANLSVNGAAITVSQFGSVPVASGSPPTTTALAVNSALFVHYNAPAPTMIAGTMGVAQGDSTGSQYINSEGRKATYSTCVTFTPSAGGSPPVIDDIFVIPGSASKTIRVTRVEVSLSTTGTASIDAVQLIKRATVDSTVGSVVATVVPHDSQYSPATSVPLYYTTCPVGLGVSLGAIRGVQFNNQSATLPGAATWLWTFGDRPATAIVLRGTIQTLCVNLGNAVAVQTAVVSVEWTEE